jgi:2-dehydro-3-deoxyphosphogalactonate aldolase
MPGFITPSEAFIAINAGARRLKLFPSMAFSPAYLRAIREVIPRDIAIWAVGGTGVGNIHDWLDAGSQGIGVGTSLYRPGYSAAIVAGRARELVDAWRKRSSKT